MTERTQYRDNETGQWTTAEANQADPQDVTAVTVRVAQPDRLGDIRAEIVRLTDSDPSLTLHAVPGIELTGTDPLDLYERALIAIRAAVGEGDA